MGEGCPRGDVSVGGLDRRGRQVSPGHGDERRRPKSDRREEDRAQADGEDGGEQVSCAATV